MLPYYRGGGGSEERRIGDWTIRESVDSCRLTYCRF